MHKRLDPLLFHCLLLLLDSYFANKKLKDGIEQLEVSYKCSTVMLGVKKLYL